MSEANWYKMVVISVLLHILIIGVFSVPIKKSGKKIDHYYSINLVGDMGGSAGQAGKMAAPATPAEAKKPSVPAPQKKEEPKKAKPVPVKEKERAVSSTKEKSLVPVKKNVPETTTKDEVKSLDQRIRELKKRNQHQYMDVAGKGSSGKGDSSSGLPTSSGGGSRPLDPAVQKYMLAVWERIQEAWHTPGLAFKKNLETVVSIRIRKDGRIVDVDVEQRSGNRVYDESVLRVLRGIDALPPIPAALNTDSLEIGFNFHPPGEMR